MDDKTETANLFEELVLVKGLLKNAPGLLESVFNGSKEAKAQVLFMLNSASKSNQACIDHVIKSNVSGGKRKATHILSQSPAQHQQFSSPTSNHLHGEDSFDYPEVIEKKQMTDTKIFKSPSQPQPPVSPSNHVGSKPLACEEIEKNKTIDFDESISQPTSTLQDNLEHLDDPVVFEATFPWKKPGNLEFMDDPMRFFMNHITGEERERMRCWKCCLPWKTHGYKGKCPIVQMKTLQGPKFCGLQCLFPSSHCNGKQCQHANILMIVVIVCSDCLVNGIVEKKWHHYSNGNRALLESFTKGKDMTADDMASICMKLVKDQAFRKCFWDSIDATGIFSSKFIGGDYDNQKVLSEKLSKKLDSLQG